MLLESRCPSILVVHDLEVNLQRIATSLDHAQHKILTVRSGEGAIEILEREPIDLIILDLSTGGVECCRRIRANRSMRLIPVIMVTCAGCADEEAGVRSGADELLAEPFDPDLLRARVRSMLRHKAKLDSLEDSENVLFALAQAAEHRDHNTAGHCERLAVFSVFLGMAMQLPRQHLLALHRGGYLHDIGKLGVPDRILLKPGPLSPDEWRIMRTHTIRGEEICRTLRSMTAVLPIIRSHHERWDGSGYPDGLKGEAIPLLARVLQLADVYDALTTIRPYKCAIPSDEALRMMEEEAGRGWRDPALMRVFAQLPHELLRDTANRNAADWQDAEATQLSLERLRHAVA